MASLATTTSSNLPPEGFSLELGYDLIFPWISSWIWRYFLNIHEFLNVYFHEYLHWVHTFNSFPRLWNIASSSLTSHLTPTSWAQRFLAPKLWATRGYIMQCIEQIFRSNMGKMRKMGHCVVWLQNYILSIPVHFVSSVNYLIQQCWVGG